MLPSAVLDPKHLTLPDSQLLNRAKISGHHMAILSGWKVLGTFKKVMLNRVTIYPGNQIYVYNQDTRDWREVK